MDPTRHMWNGGRTRGTAAGQSADRNTHEGPERIPDGRYGSTKDV
ncbi:hypothetical protein ACFYXM_22910 [Streptomyces sp. NPDC002476]